MGFTLGCGTAETNQTLVNTEDTLLSTFIGCEFRTHISPVQCDEGPTVAHGVAVVGSAEHCDALPVMHHLVAFLLDIGELTNQSLTVPGYPP